VRGDKLIARTRDHSYSELQQTMSQVVPMGDRFNRNVLFTCLGSPGKPVVDTVGPLLMQAGDRLLLCSDGLWGTVSDSEITDQLANLPLSDSVPELVEQALRNGGAKCDNVSVLAVEFEGAENAESGHGVQTNALGEAVFASTDPGERARHRRRLRRARRRGDRALDQGNQRGDPAQREAQEELTSSILPGRRQSPP
jgi:serine/threonine protein phosphatase PrpC